MPVGQLITLGIGTPGTIGLLDTTGLGNLVPPAGSPTMPSSLISGLASNLVAGVVYSLPARVINLEWQTSVAGLLEVSLNNSNWTTLDTAAGADVRLVSSVCAVFIRPTINVTVVCRKIKNRL